MRIKMYTVAVSLIASGIAMLVMGGASAQTVPHKTTVGVMVDSQTGDTYSTINCFTEGSDGRFVTGPNGDATLLMANRDPHTVICVINIKPILGAQELKWASMFKDSVLDQAKRGLSLQMRSKFM